MRVDVFFGGQQLTPADVQGRVVRGDRRAARLDDDRRRARQRRASRHPVRELRRGRSRARSSSSARTCCSPASGRCSRSRASTSATLRASSRARRSRARPCCSRRRTARVRCSPVQGARDVVVASYVNYLCGPRDAARGAARRRRRHDRVRGQRPAVRARGRGLRRPVRHAASPSGSPNVATERRGAGVRRSSTGSTATTSMRLFEDSAHGRALADAGFGEDLARVRRRGFAPGDPDLPGPPDHQARTRPGAVSPVGSTSLKRELAGIALLLFAVFLAGALSRSRAARCVGGRATCAHELRLRRRTASRSRSSRFFGMARGRAAVPLVPAVHALRLFGRLESETDRSWLVFLARRRRAAAGRVRHSARERARRRRVDAAAGLWGGFVAYYWRACVRRVGAWLVLAARRERADGGDARAGIPMRDDRRPARARSPTRAGARRSPRREEPYAPPKQRAGKQEPADVALALEPPPEEMPAIDRARSLQATASADADADGGRARSRKRRSAEGKKKPTPPTSTTSGSPRRSRRRQTPELAERRAAADRAARRRRRRATSTSGSASSTRWA